MRLSSVTVRLKQTITTREKKVETVLTITPAPATRTTASRASAANGRRKCRDLPGQHLFQYRGDDGKPRPIGSSDVNAYLRDAAGGEFTAKDFRTWAGTVAAVDRLAKLPLSETKTATERAIVGVVREVADTLGNTPAVCRKSYIHPTALDAFVKGCLPSARSHGGLTGGESRVLRLLSV